MATQRKQYSAECKARVALEARKGRKPVHERASTYGVHPPQMAHGKHRLHKERPEMFSARRAKRAHDHEAFQAQLSQHIGPRKVELEGVKQKAGLVSCGEAGVDGARASPAQSRATRCAVGGATVHLLVPNTGGEGCESPCDAVAGAAIYRDP